MLKRAVQFLVSHKLASAAFLLPIVGWAACAAVLAYQHRPPKKKRQMVYPPVRDAVDEPVAPPTLDELEVVLHPLENAWRH